MTILGNKTIISVIAVFSYFFATQEDALSTAPSFLAGIENFNRNRLKKVNPSNQGPADTKVVITNLKDPANQGEDNTGQKIRAPSAAQTISHELVAPVLPLAVSVHTGDSTIPNEITELANAFYDMDDPTTGADILAMLNNFIEGKNESRQVKPNIAEVLGDILCNSILMVTKIFSGQGGNDTNRALREDVKQVLQKYGLPLERPMITLCDDELVSKLAEIMLTSVNEASGIKNRNSIDGKLANVARFFRKNRADGTLETYKAILESVLPKAVEIARQQILSLEREQQELTNNIKTDKNIISKLDAGKNYLKKPEIGLITDIKRKMQKVKSLQEEDAKKRSNLYEKVSKNEGKLLEIDKRLCFLKKVDGSYLRGTFLDEGGKKAEKHYETAGKKTKITAITTTNSSVSGNTLKLDNAGELMLRNFDQRLQTFLRLLLATKAGNDGSVVLRLKSLKNTPVDANKENIGEDKIAKENDAISYFSSNISALQDYCEKRKYKLDALDYLANCSSIEGEYVLPNKEYAIQAAIGFSDFIASAKDNVVRRGKLGKHIAIDILANEVLKSRNPNENIRNAINGILIQAMKNEIRNNAELQVTVWKCEYIALYGREEEKALLKDIIGNIAAQISNAKRSMVYDFRVRSEKLLQELKKLASASEEVKSNPTVRQVLPFAEDISVSTRYLRTIGLRTEERHQEAIVQVLDTIADGDCAFRAIAPDDIWRKQTGAAREWAANLLLDNIDNDMIREHIGAEIAYRRDNNTLPKAVSETLTKTGNDTTAIKVVTSYIENFVRPTVVRYEGKREANYLEFPSQGLPTTVATAIASILGKNLIVIDARDGTVLYGADKRNTQLPDLIVAQDENAHICRTRLVQ